jgi:hypothetical protein
VRRWLLAVLTWLLAIGMGAGWSVAQEGRLSARHHCWGRFHPGAWKLVRVVSETLDEHGVVMSTSTTETKTTLTKIEPDAIVLEVEVGIEVAGKQFDGQPQCIKQGFHGESAGPEVKVKPAHAAQVRVEDRQVECRREEVDFDGPSSRTTTNVYYSDTVAPYVLKRDSTTTDPEGKSVLAQVTQEVVAVGMPQKVLTEIKNTSCIKTVQKHAKGTVTTLAMTAEDVPGGVVYHTSKETDQEGRLVRRSTLELVGYGLQAEKERHGLFGRKRPRPRKSAAFPPAH